METTLDTITTLDNKGSVVQVGKFQGWCTRSCDLQTVDHLFLGIIIK